MDEYKYKFQIYSWPKNWVLIFEDLIVGALYSNVWIDSCYTGGGGGRPSFSPWTCELCSQEMDCLTGNFTKYFKSINKFDLFLSFCRWKVLGISANLNFWCIFSCIKQQTSTKYHKKSGWHCRGSQEGKKKKTPCLPPPSPRL